MRACTRCGQRFAVTRLDQHRCPLCEREVQITIASDARRNVIRFPRAADFTGRIAA
jgi:hypothetical protein